MTDEGPIEFPPRKYDQVTVEAGAQGRRDPSGMNALRELSNIFMNLSICGKIIQTQPDGVHDIGL
jgi:hypothetical protein